ncbi:hypothetical protein V1227_22315 [Lentzea sp. DG1S-22]|uniref:hypothetical protein n=1 Tax=Lentzea sp. DG1S-22 TaxID=3108822 RepID=UPI002E77E1AF|nr:hypothetical protein [Lentzea sp. DG1S-22]WVH77838.1 hypothetical protein V1227_22315 [Lentzea sp. DG1S-22]
MKSSTPWPVPDTFTSTDTGTRDVVFGESRNEVDHGGTVMTTAGAAVTAEVLAEALK